MQQAIERVECGNKESKGIQKATLGMMTPGTPNFVEPLHPDLKTPSIIPFPSQINFDAPPFVCLGTSFIHAVILFARCDSCTP